MSKTLSTLRADTRHYLDESAQADWLDSDLTRIINKNYHRVVTAVIEVFENYYITEATTDMVASQQEYALPSDFLKIRRVEANYDIDSANSSFSRCLPIDIDSIRYNLANNNAGVTILRNPAYYVQGNLIGFIPIPTNNGDEAIKLWYVALKSDLVEDTDTIDIPYVDRYYGIITKATAAEALRKGQQESAEAKRLEDEAQADIERMKRELVDRVAEESKTVINVDGDDLDFGNPSGLL
jgi:hypothetical protein